MAGNDKAIHAFLRGAFSWGKWCMLFVLVSYSALWCAGFHVGFIPRRAESVLWIAPWLLAGGLLALAKHFSRERPVQFSIRLLLLITLLFSLSLTWNTLARTRYRKEQRAIAALEERFDWLGLGTRGLFFPAVWNVRFYNRDELIYSDNLSFVIQQLKYLPGLWDVNFDEECLSEEDLATLRAAFPDVVFTQQ